MGARKRTAFLVVVGILLVILIGVVVFLRTNRKPEQPVSRGESVSKPVTADASRTGTTREGKKVEDAGEKAGQSDIGNGGTGSEDEIDAEGSLNQETGYSISGCVVDEQGEALREAEVIASERHPERYYYGEVKRVVTDDEGRFALGDVPRKDLFLRAEKDGYCFYLTDIASYGLLAHLLPVHYSGETDTVEEVKIVLHPGAVLGGKVVDSKDRPVMDAEVSIHAHIHYTSPRFDLKLRVDEEGRFRASSLVPGDYLLGVKAEGLIQSESYWNVTAGQEDLLIRLEPGCPVRGRVVFAESGEPVPGATVWSSPAGKSGTTDAAGNFEVRILSNKEVVLRARWENYFNYDGLGVRCQEGDLLSGIVIELSEGGSISGIVMEKKTGKPVAGMHVRVTEGLSDTSDEEGRFKISGISVGRTVVSIYSKEYKCARDDYIYVDVEAGEDTSGVKVEVVRMPEAGMTKVSGTVVDEEEKPIAGAAISPATGERAAVATGETVMSNEQGRFAVESSRLGVITGLLVTHPEFAHRFVMFGKDGFPRDKENVRIILEQGGTIEGYVTDREGEPKRHIKVTLLVMAPRIAERSGFQLKSAVTDDSGYYRLGGIGKGTYRIRGRFRERNIESEEVSIGPGRDPGYVNLVVGLAGHIAGKITDEQGSPVDGLKIQISCAEQRQGGYGQRGGTTETDSEGKYRFENLEEGEKYRVSVMGAKRQGYWRFTPRPREVVASADDVDFEVRIPEYGSIKGSVYRKSDGRPVSDFVVHLDYDRYPARKYESEDGSFVCDKLMPGKHYIKVTGSGLAETKSKTVEVKENSEATVEIYMEEACTIMGCVYRASDKSPVKEFFLTLNSAQRGYAAAYLRKKFLSEDGSFICSGIEPGEYSITITAEDLPRFKTEPFEVKAHAENKRDICISEGGTVKGRVVNESEHGVPGAVVEVRQPQVYGAKTLEQKTTTDEIGAFVLRNLTPGEIRLKVTHPEYATLHPEEITVKEDEVTDKIVLQLERGTLVYGWFKDVDGNKKGNVPVQVINSSAGYDAHVRTDYRGEYRFAHVPKGTCHLALRYREPVLPFFEIKDEEEKEVNIDFSSAGRISGKVYLFSPPEGTKVMLDVYGHDERVHWRVRAKFDVAVRDDGTFEIEGLLPGKYEIELRGYRELDSGVTSQLTFTTSPKKIEVNISPREELIEDITVIEITEPSKKE